MAELFTYIVIGVTVLIVHFLVTKAAVKAGIREVREEDNQKG